MVPWLSEGSPAFPTSEQALDHPPGLLAAGGELSPDWLIHAYSLGIFPWYSEDQPILWWSPTPRTVFFPDKLHISKSLKKAIKKMDYQVSMDLAFSQVVYQCAATRADKEGTWITEDIFSAYEVLHDKGHAHSIEIWHERELVGGLYGVSLGKVFFGESMFSIRSNSSKIALAYLAKQLAEWNFAIIDCQVYNDHLASLGAILVDRAMFGEYLTQNATNINKHLPLFKPQFLGPYFD